jgi:hypothetical protein
VGGDRQQVDPEGGDVHRDLAQGVHRVAVEQRPGLVGDLRHRGDVVQVPDLVVREHHRDQHRLVGDRRPELLEVVAAAAIHSEQAHLRPVLRAQEARHVEDRLVLDRRRDDVASPALLGEQHPHPGRVVGLGAAAREEEVAGLCADEGSDLRARIIDPTRGLPTRPVDRRRVAPLLGVERPHGVQDRPIDRRRGVVVHVDAGHLRSLVPSPSCLQATRGASAVAILIPIPGTRNRSAGSRRTPALAAAARAAAR